MDRPDLQKRLLKWLEENAWWFAFVGLPAAAGLFAYLAQWNHGELIELVVVLLGAVVLMTGLLFWRRVRLAQADAAVRQSMLQRGLAPEEMERLLRGPSEPPQPPRTEAQSVEELAACLQRSGVSAPVVEQIFAAVRVAEPPLRQPLCHAIRGLAGESGAEADEDQLLAAVRGLCGNDSLPAQRTPAAEESNRVSV